MRKFNKRLSRQEYMKVAMFVTAHVDLFEKADLSRRDLQARIEKETGFPITKGQLYNVLVDLDYTERIKDHNRGGYVPGSKSLLAALMAVVVRLCAALGEPCPELAVFSSLPGSRVTPANAGSTLSQKDGLSGPGGQQAGDAKAIPGGGGTPAIPAGSTTNGGGK